MPSSIREVWGRPARLVLPDGFMHYVVWNAPIKGCQGFCSASWGHSKGNNILDSGAARYWASLIRVGRDLATNGGNRIASTRRGGWRCAT
jgi:hypothetical protein